jgi:uncharacterized protein (UPF0262 family)
MTAGAQVDRIVAVHLNEASLGHASPEVQHERQVAIHDLMEANRFAPVGHEGRRWTLTLAIIDHRLAIDMTDEAGGTLHAGLPLTQIRRIVKDYFLTCDSYFAAVRTAPAAAIEALDFERKGLHDAGARLIEERLAEAITMDFATARRLFTVIASLYWKG